MNPNDPNVSNSGPTDNTPTTAAADTGGTNPQAPQTVASQTPTPQPANTTPQTQTPTQLPPSGTMQPTPLQPQQTTQPAQPKMVSNPAPVSTLPQSPEVSAAVQHASGIHQVLTALAGGNPIRTTIDPTTGVVSRKEVPVSNARLGMSIALAALTGAFNGLAQHGPGAKGVAAAQGFNAGVQQQQQAKAQAEAQAQADADSQAKAYARQAATFEANSRGILNVSNAEALGADAIDKLVAINRTSGILDPDSDSVDNNGIPLTQAELQSKLADGSISFGDALGPVAGRVEVSNPDGSKRWEATHLVIKDPAGLVTVTPEAWKMYSDAGVPGFSSNTSIGQNGVGIKRSIVQTANEQVASKTLVEHRLGDLKTELAGTPFADKVPTSIDFTQPGVRKAMTAYQKYVSHNADNLMDAYAALQQMGADKRNPTTGQLQPNPDAKFVDAAATALGGWPLLRAAHDQIAANTKSTEEFNIIDTEAKAESVLSSPKKFSNDQVSAARNFVRLTQTLGVTKASDEARARAVAEGKDTEAMQKTGVNPITGERLSLANAPDSMLVTSTGTVVPQNQQSLYKPSATETQTADTARQVLAITKDLRTMVANDPRLAGPIAGRTVKAFAKIGIGTDEAQKFIGSISLLQSAATKMHTGRFSVPMIDKMNALVNQDMNPDQFRGALDSLEPVAQRYANEDQLRTVASYRQQQQQATQPNVVPQGAQAVRVKGVVTGYALNGKYTAFPTGSK